MSRKKERNGMPEPSNLRDSKRVLEIGTVIVKGKSIKFEMLDAGRQKRQRSQRGADLQNTWNQQFIYNKKKCMFGRPVSKLLVIRGFREDRT